jgi:hypothetical protein
MEASPPEEKNPETLTKESNDEEKRLKEEREQEKAVERIQTFARRFHWGPDARATPSSELALEDVTSGTEEMSEEEDEYDDYDGTLEKVEHLQEENDRLKVEIGSLQRQVRKLQSINQMMRNQMTANDLELARGRIYQSKSSDRYSAGASGGKIPLKRRLF